MQGRYKFQFWFSKQRIRRVKFENKKEYPMLKKRYKKKIMDYLTCVHVLFIINFFFVFRSKEFSVLLHLIVTLIETYHHIATHSRLMNWPPFTKIPYYLPCILIILNFNFIWALFEFLMRFRAYVRMCSMCARARPLSRMYISFLAV